VNTVNNKGVDVGTTNVTLYGTDIKMSSSDSTTVKNAIPVKATSTPSNLGTAAIGSSAKYAAEDHVHNMPSASDVGALPSTTTAADLLSNLTYSTDGLAFSSSYSSGSSILGGGYCKIGRLVIVNMRITVGTTVPAGQVFMTGFPAVLSTLSSTTGVVAMSASNPDVSVSMQVRGYIVNGSSSSSLSGNYMLSAVYLTSE
jgi:hypothetical protein